MSIVADYPNEYTNCFHHGDKDDKYYYYLFLSKATKESITNECCQINCLYYIVYMPILNASFLLSVSLIFLLRLQWEICPNKVMIFPKSWMKINSIYWNWSSYCCITLLNGEKNELSAILSKQYSGEVGIFGYGMSKDAVNIIII